MRRVLLVLALVVGMLAGAATSGSARETTTDDPGGGGVSYLNLYKVKVVNNAKGVRITVKMHPIDWVEFSPFGMYRLLIDTNASSRGAEFANEFNLPGHAGFRALKGSKAKRKSWRNYPYNGKCGRTVRERFDGDAGKMTLLIKPRKGCLFHPKRVRVNVRTIEYGYTLNGRSYDNDPPIVDHLPYKNSFTTWVKYSRR